MSRDDPRKLHLFPRNADYFIDPVGGNDANLGTTPNAPWATVEPLKADTTAFDFRRIALLLAGEWQWMDAAKFTTTAGPIAGNFIATINGPTVQWLFGDGTFAAGNAANHAYAAEGSKTVIAYALTSAAPQLTINQSYTALRLADLPAGLTYLYCDGTAVTGALADLPAGLTFLSCGGTAVTGALADLPAGLTYLYCYGTAVTGALADLPAGLVVLYCAGTAVTGEISGLGSITQVYAQNNAITSYTVGTFATQAGMTVCNFNNCHLLETAVDAVLADLVISLSVPGRVICSVDLDGAGNASPSDDGYDSADLLVIAGWSVTTN